MLARCLAKLTGSVAQMKFDNSQATLLHSTVSLEENLSMIIICCNLLIAIHNEKVHKMYRFDCLLEVLVVNRNEKPSIDNQNAILHFLAMSCNGWL